MSCSTRKAISIRQVSFTIGGWSSVLTKMGKTWHGEVRQWNQRDKSQIFWEFSKRISIVLSRVQQQWQRFGLPAPIANTHPSALTFAPPSSYTLPLSNYSPSLDPPPNARNNPTDQHCRENNPTTNPTTPVDPSSSPITTSTHAPSLLNPLIRFSRTPLFFQCLQAKITLLYYVKILTSWHCSTYDWTLVKKLHFLQHIRASNKLIAFATTCYCQREWRFWISKYMPCENRRKPQNKGISGGAKWVPHFPKKLWHTQ